MIQSEGWYFINEQIKGSDKTGLKQYRMSEVTGFGIHKVFFFLTKTVKEILWDNEFMSDVTGCRKPQVSDCTGSTVHTVNYYW